MSRHIIGVDPGSISAGFAFISWDVGVDAASAFHMPVVSKMVDARAFYRVIGERKPTHAVVERVSAMPKQGVSSSFRFGMGYGLILGVLASSHIQIIDVSPGLWKKHFRLDSDKEKSRALAIKRFPDVDLSLKKDAGRAEALLMALWLRETGQ